MKNTLTTGKTIMLSVILFIIGYVITYVGFRNMTSQPHISEEQMELFFLYCSPNVLLMTMAIFLIVQKYKFAPLYHIYLIKYNKMWVGHLYDTLFHCRNWLLNHRKINIPIALQIPITGILVFILSWGIVALIYKFMPRYAKWIMG